VTRIFWFALPDGLDAPPDTQKVQSQPEPRKSYVRALTNFDVTCDFQHDRPNSP
jgi:hypothetical protein